MLLHLHIENYALIRSLDIAFDDQFTVITGETGAGKSIILGALSLILGNRADTNLLYDKTKKCYIEGVFNISSLPLNHFFEEHNLDYDPHTILRREINEAGKSRAFINDTPVTLPVLKELATSLLDIHSQHQNLLFSNSLFRINILDQFAGSEKCLKEYQNLFIHYDKINKELECLSEVQLQSLQEKQFAEFLLQELDETHLEAGEQEKIEEQIRISTNAELIQSHLADANQLLTENEFSVVPLLKKVSKNLTIISNYNTDIQAIIERMNDILINVEDISFELARMNDTTSFNPELLENLQERLDKIYSLQQKHHLKSVEELIIKREMLQRKLFEIEDNQEKINYLKKEREKFYHAAMQKAKELSELRTSKISAFTERIESMLRELGMENAIFSIRIEKREELSSTGLDVVQFYFSANKGVLPEEIGKVASGGELSRVMLAVKSIITEESLLPTILFDEIDTGISGKTAGKVANMMKNVSSYSQLIAITHLAQIAAKGKRHYYVYKETIGDKTYTNIKALSRDERITEIANMMSGEGNATSAREVAEKLLTDFGKKD